MRRIAVWFVCIAILIPSASFAGPIRKSAIQASATTQLRTNDYEDWQMRLSEARTKKSQGMKWLLTGAVVAGAGILLMGLEKAKTVTIGGEGDPGNKALGLIGVAAGGGIATYGGLKYSAAASELSELEREGQRRGYSSNRGVGAGVTFSF